MWMPESSNNSDLDMNSSVKLTKYMRSTKLKPAFCRHTTYATIATPSCSRYGYVNTVLAGTNHCLANETENYKRELINEQQLENGRWNPTPGQLLALEEMYRCRTRTPTLDEIQHIASQLRRYGKIEGKNVFYWFQNHKARDRLKRHREDRTSCGQLKQDHRDLENQGCAGQSRKVHELEPAKKSTVPSHSSKNFEVNGAAVSMNGAHTWSQFIERDCHQKTRSSGRHAMWDITAPPFSPSVQLTSNIISTRSRLLNHEDCRSLSSKSKKVHHLILLDEDETRELQTLQLFPLNSDYSNITDTVDSAKKDREVPFKTINRSSSPHQFFEFLPLKN